MWITLGTAILVTALPAHAVTQVTIQDFSFTPASLKVAQGTSVVWHYDISGSTHHTSTQNAPLVPGIDPFKTELEGFLAQARDLKIQQETLEGQRMGITQKLEKVSVAVSSTPTRPLSSKLSSSFPTYVLPWSPVAVT